KVAGATLPAQIWSKFMLVALKGKQVASIPHSEQPESGFFDRDDDYNQGPVAHASPWRDDRGDYNRYSDNRSGQRNYAPSHRGLFDWLFGSDDDDAPPPPRQNYQRYPYRQR